MNKDFIEDTRRLFSHLDIENVEVKSGNVGIQNLFDQKKLSNDAKIQTDYILQSCLRFLNTRNIKIK
jgi:hypothetical protein